uniref:HDC06929 n=2 Tax=Drosophila melanogaster TaxID=7227 RepID=Q6IG91_DROME|nr:roadblock similar 54B, isoform A [Drosophila melanogaster]NP_001286528.1 roadblock similar 54B, isoform B [Drosophila melanogaster]ABV53834.1 roadblock similar 54B, isoform A [Drosophila melanogaster]AHN56324.1 roadblock similar 54B, isoform B [Drosophila melanogaster]DAA02573.1 TPA_inf: HDC06929 [Drosophila melanogaster]|eukprot:NP_001097356.1 roadblock similar 54B, isoform A [Drosophila melanogaster]
MFPDLPQKPPRTLRYVEKAFDLVKSKKHVRDVVILNESGHPVMSTMDREDAVQFSGPFQAIRGRLERGMSKIDPTDELLMLRIRTRTNEVLLVPDSKITLLVVQNAHDYFEK